MVRMMRSRAVVVNMVGIALMLVSPRPATATPPIARPVPSVRATLPVDPAKCRPPGDAWYSKTRDALNQTTTSMPVNAIDETTELADLRDVTNGTRDLTAAYRLCAPVPWEKSPEYASLVESLRHRSPTLTTAQTDAIAQRGAVYVQGQQAQLAIIVGPAEAWATATDAAIDREVQCRAAPKCMTDRVQLRIRQAAEPVCQMLYLRAQSVANIAAENSNPSGVRDLQVMHDEGASIQAFDAQLPALKARYAAVAHKPFATSVCPK
jgi:hypothetical protein